MNLIAALALASFVAAPEPMEAPKPESIEGEWTVVQMIRDGREVKVKVATVTIKGDKMILKDDDQKAESVITLDPKATPATIDIRAKQNGAESDPHKGI